MKEQNEKEKEDPERKKKETDKKLPKEDQKILIKEKEKKTKQQVDELRKSQSDMNVEAENNDGEVPKDEEIKIVDKVDEVGTKSDGEKITQEGKKTGKRQDCFNFFFVKTQIEKEKQEEKH